VVWIFLAVGVLLIFTSPAVRNIGLAILGSGLVVFLVIVILNRRPAAQAPGAGTPPALSAGAASRRFDFDQYQRDKKDREDPDAKTRIPLSAVHFDQVQAVSGIDPGTLRSIRARVYNDSKQFALTDYSYYLEVQDCLPAKPDDKHESQCTTVFDQNGTVSTTVPPDQARDVLVDLTNDSKTGSAPFKLLGTPRIELTPTMTRAYITADQG
jgi:hypothetical protein